MTTRSDIAEQIAGLRVAIIEYAEERQPSDPDLLARFDQLIRDGNYILGPAGDPCVCCDGSGRKKKFAGRIIGSDGGSETMTG